MSCRDFINNVIPCSIHSVVVIVLVEGKCSIGRVKVLGVGQSSEWKGKGHIIICEIQTTGGFNFVWCYYLGYCFDLCA